MLEAVLIGLILLTPVIIAIVFLVKLVQVSGKVKKLEANMQKVMNVLGLEGGAEAEKVRPAAKREAPSVRDEPRTPDVVVDVPPPVPQVAEAGANVPATPEVSESQGDSKTRGAVPSTASKKPKPSPVTSQPSQLRRSRGEWESLIGGKWLNRIGAFALIIAMGFFLKYAFDNNLINETMRVGIGGVIGLALVAGGWWAERKDLRVFAQGLVGAGISTLYISVYASFNFYHLLPQIPAFVLMSAVTALTLYQAFRYDSVAVAVLGLLGGFMTPFFLSTGTVNTVGLFSYILLLDVGLLGIVLYKDRWAALDILTLIGTVTVYTLWFEEYYTEPEAGLGLLFLAAYWVLFIMLEMVRMVRAADSPKWARILREITFGLAAVLFYSIMQGIVIDDLPAAEPWLSLGLGVVYFGMTWLAWKRGEHGANMVRTEITAALLIAMAITLEYENYPVISLLAVEALLIVLAGRAMGVRHVRMTGFGMMGLAFLSMFFVPGAVGVGTYTAADMDPVLNLRVVAWIALAGSMAFIAWLEQREERPIRYIADTMHLGWALALFIPVAVELSDAFVRTMAGLEREAKQLIRYQQVMSVTMLTAAFGAMLSWLGAKRELVSVRATGIVLVFSSVLSIMTLGWRFVPVDAFTPVVNIRVLTMLIVIAALLADFFILRKHYSQRDWYTALAGTLRVTAALAGLLLLTGEVLDYYRLQMFGVKESGLTGTDLTDALRPLENMQQLALSIAWLVFSIALMAYGFLRKVPIQRIVAFAVFGISILKIFIYDLQFLDTLYRIFSFIGLGIILLVVSYLYTRYKDVILGKEDEEEAV